LKRRCLYLHLDYPSLERERAIVLTKVPGVSDELADQVARIVRSLRSLELKKHPPSPRRSTGPDARAARDREVDSQTACATLHILLKHRSDIEVAAKELAAAAGH